MTIIIAVSSATASTIHLFYTLNSQSYSIFYFCFLSFPKHVSRNEQFFPQAGPQDLRASVQATQQGQHSLVHHEGNHSEQLSVGQQRKRIR